LPPCTGTQGPSGGEARRACRGIKERREVSEQRCVTGIERGNRGDFGFQLGTKPERFLSEKGPRTENRQRPRRVRCGQGQNRTADTRIFSPRAGAGLSVSVAMVSIQAFDAAFSRSILPIRTHSVI